MPGVYNYPVFCGVPMAGQPVPSAGEHSGWERGPQLSHTAGGALASQSTTGAGSGFGGGLINDGDAVVAYDTNSLTGTWSATRFSSCTVVPFTYQGRVAPISSFPLEPGCDNYNFLEQEVQAHRESLPDICVNVPTLQTGLDEESQDESEEAPTWETCSGYQ